MGYPVKSAIRLCPVCENDKAEVLHHQRFVIPPHHHLPAHYDVVCCVSCKFVYVDTSATQTVYDAYYESFSKYESSNSSGSGSNPLDASRLQQTAAAIHEKINDLNASILDIGCANGGLLVELQKLGYSKLTGLDPSQGSVTFVRDRLGLMAFKGGLFTSFFSEEESKQGEKYDVIILSHVMEHVLDLGGAINAVLRRLKDNGCLYIEVPDASRYDEHFVVPYYYFDCEHINHFDQLALRSLCEKHGLAFLGSGTKNLQVTEHLNYPAAYGFFKKAQQNHVSQLSCGTEVRKSVLAHCAQSDARTSIYDQLEHLKNTGEELLVWGAGSYTLRLLETTALGGCNIKAFVDQDPVKQGSYILGCPVIAPSDAAELNGKIVICSALHHGEIISTINNLKMLNELLVL